MNKGTKKLKVHPIGSGITMSPGLVFSKRKQFKIKNRAMNNFNLKKKSGDLVS